MRAAQLVAPRKWELLDLEKPKATDGTMLVRLERVAICGTDKPSYVGLSPSYPLDPGNTGHEGLGIVESCPSGKYREGERVLLWAFDRGLFQEYVLARDEGCVRLPADGELEVILMSQLLGTVIHAFYKLGNIIGKKVVVLGQGPVGQLFNATLRNLGARQIIAVDPLAHRLDTARKMGATDTVDPASGDLKQAIADLTGGELADIVVEAVGREETFNLAAGLVRRNGSIVYFGVPNKDNHEGIISLQFMKMFANEVRIITTVGPNPQKDYSLALDWIVQGRLDVRPMISHVLPFEEIQRAFEMAFDCPGEHKTVKVVMRM